MCIAAPMRIIAVDRAQGKAHAELNGNELLIDTRLVSPEVGDYVLVHAGCALEIVREDTAGEMLELWAELEEAVSDER